MHESGKTTTEHWGGPNTLLFYFYRCELILHRQLSASNHRQLAAKVQQHSLPWPAQQSSPALHITYLGGNEAAACFILSLLLI